MTLSQREKAFIVMAVFALAIFVFIRFLYLPGQARIADLQTANQQLGQEQQRLEAILQKQEESKPVSEDTDLASLSQKLPTEEEMIPVLKFLDESTPKCDIELSSLEYRGAKEGEEGQTRSLTFAVDTSGSIFDLIDFLQELQTAPRFISVADVSLNACKSEQSSTAEDGESTPTYYIAPPGIPQAKLDRVKIEIVEEKAANEQPERRVADSFTPDEFDMKVTIIAYYAPEQPVNAEAEGDSTGEAENAADDSEGRI
jgi:Tfp pilus assembly protein PilO